MRMAHIMDKTPGAPVVENIQLVFAVSFYAPAPCGFHRASASLVTSPGMDAARGSVVENIPTFGVLHKLSNL